MAFIPTLCEVTYDSDFIDGDKYSTPYRVPHFGNRTNCREHGNFGLDRLSVHARSTALSYYDYLRSYYLEQSCSQSSYGGSITSPSLPSRSQTTFGWYVPLSEDAIQASFRGEHRDSAREHLSLPALLKSPTPGGDEKVERVDKEEEGRKLMWVDALNSWVPHKALQKKTSPKKSPDLISRKQNRKAYSTPLSNAENRRKQGVHLGPPQTPEPEAETQPQSFDLVQPAWASSEEEKEEEELQGGEEEGDYMEGRLELRVPMIEAVTSGQELDDEEREDGTEEQRKIDSHSPDYQLVPPMFLTPSPPPLPPTSPSNIHHSTESRCSSHTTVYSETVDTVPTVPSVSIQFVGKEPHQHNKSVNFPAVVATDIVEIEPASRKVPYRVGRPLDKEGKGTRLGIRTQKGNTQHRMSGRITEQARRVMDVVDTELSDRKPPDKSEVKVTESVNDLVSQKKPKPPSLQPPPLNKAKTSPQVKKKSPKKPVVSKPSKTLAKPSTPKVIKSPQQQQKTSKSTSKHKKASKSKPVRLDKPPSSCKSSQGEDKPQPLPVSLPVVTTKPPPPSPSPSPSVESVVHSSEQPVDTAVAQETETIPKGRTKIKKRERVNRRPCKTEEVSTESQPLEIQVKKSDWIFDKEDIETQTEKQGITEGIVEQPVMLPVVPDLPSSRSQSTINRIQKKLQAFRQPIEDKKRWGPKKRDTSYEDEVRKQQLAEERRKRQADMLERLKKKRFGQKMAEDGITVIPSFEDYGFLAKYCIFSRATLEMYKQSFQAVDDERRGWLTGTEAMIALRGTNNRLTETEEEYLYRILELTGYNIAKGADFKLFSVLAALSQRISSVDHWMKNLIGRVDFKTLEMKMFMCKSLWECNVDSNTNKISLDQLMIELRAGGVSYEHECEVREKLSHLKSLDLLDFLTYVPLFIMIHEAVVDNPLDDTREK